MLGLIAVLLAAAVAMFIVKVAATDNKKTDKPAAKQPSASQFSFDGAAAPEWRKGPSNATSMALFWNSGDCFVAVESKAGTADVLTELDKVQSGLRADGYTVNTIASPTVTMQTTNGTLPFTLYQYAALGAGGQDAPYQGQALSYVPTEQGHIKVIGYCDDPVNMPATVTALEAITFRP